MKTYTTLFFIVLALSGCSQSPQVVEVQSPSWLAAFDTTDVDAAEKREIQFEKRMEEEKAASLFETMQLLDSLLAKGECSKLQSLWGLGILRKVTNVHCEDTALVNIGLLLTVDSYFDDRINFEANLNRYPALASLGQKLEIKVRHTASSQVEPFYFERIGRLDLSIRTFDSKVTNPPSAIPYSKFLMNLIDEIYNAYGTRIKIPKAEYLSFETNRGITDEYNKCVNRRKFVLFLKKEYKL